jgi:hypothetical protein
MAQIGKPNQTMLNQWDLTGLSANSALADDDDGTYISVTGSGSEECEVKLESLIDPGDNTGHKIVLRWENSNGGGAGEKIDLRLVQGVTEIASWNNKASPDALAEEDFLVDEGDATNIDDYTDLRIEIKLDTLGTGETIYIYKAWLEIPDAPVGALTIDVSDSLTNIETLD